MALAEINSDFGIVRRKTAVYLFFRQIVGNCELFHCASRFGGRCPAVLFVRTIPRKRNKGVKHSAGYGLYKAIVRHLQQAVEGENISTG